MPSPDYYRRQAASTLDLARMTTNPEIKRHLIELANDYKTRADVLYTQANLRRCLWPATVRS